MYHIKPKKDKRIQKSVAALRNGLAECLKTKSLSDISVTEICDVSNVSRATFYRLFDTPWDLLLYSCDSMTAEIVDEMLKPNQFHTKRDFILFVLEYIMRNSSMIEAVYENGRPDIFGKSLQTFSEIVSKFYLEGYGDKEVQYVKYVISAMFVGGLYMWRAGGEKDSAEDILKMMECVSLHIKTPKGEKVF